MTEIEPGLQLHRWRRLDWRFLLPTIEFHRVATGGHADPALRAAVTLLDPDTTELGSAECASTYDLVVLHLPTRAELLAAAAATRPGGWVCAEVTRSFPRLRRPGTLWGWRHAFHAAGLQEVSLYWFAPSLTAPARVVNLDQPGVIRNTLARHNNLKCGAMLAFVGNFALKLGLLPIVVPAGVVLGRRGSDPDR